MLWNRTTYWRAVRVCHTLATSDLSSFLVLHNIDPTQATNTRKYRNIPGSWFQPIIPRFWADLNVLNHDQVTTNQIASQSYWQTSEHGSVPKRFPNRGQSGIEIWPRSHPWLPRCIRFYNSCTLAFPDLSDFSTLPLRFSPVFFQIGILSRLLTTTLNGRQWSKRFFQSKTNAVLKGIGICLDHYNLCHWRL